VPKGKIARSNAPAILRAALIKAGVTPDAPLATALLYPI
jgi:hypothetical protein